MLLLCFQKNLKEENKRSATQNKEKVKYVLVLFTG